MAQVESTVLSVRVPRPFALTIYDEKAGGDERMSQIFWGTGVAAAAGIAVGHVFNEGPAMIAGNVSLAAPVIYLAVDLGAAVLLLGGVLLFWFFAMR